MGKLFRRITSFDNLTAAWDEVTDHRTAPGIDGMTRETFAREWEANLIALQTAARSHRYKPAPLKHFTIPKKDGSLRRLGNLTLRDKILQRAVLRVLDDIFEQYFLDCSYGYRPHRSVQQAVETVVRARTMGFTWVLDADIDDFFNKIDHFRLLRFLQETIADRELLQLIVQWLNIGCPDTGWAMGIPMGAVISPLLANIYLHYLDLVMTGAMSHPAWYHPPPGIETPHWVYVRYADDFIVLCRNRPQAELAFRWAETTINTLLLSLEPSKTVITTFDDGFEYLGCTFKGQIFYFNYKNERVKVDTATDWNLFYQYGPDGYP